MSAIAVDPGAPLFILFNGGSGHQEKAEVRAVVERLLSRAGREHHVRVVEDPTQLGAAARETVARARARAGVVVAAGGDGTINAVVQAALGSGCPFGVLPQGTFNYFSRTHGIPADPVQATQVLLTARAHPVQVGLVNDKAFIVNASLGLYPELLEDREAYKQQFGRSRVVAFWSALATLLREHRQLRLAIEHRDETRGLRTPTLFIGNNRLQLERIGIAQAELLEHGHLVALASRPLGTLAMFGLLMRGALGRLGDADSVTSFAFRRIGVQPALRYGSSRIKVAVDGEVLWLKTPLDVRVSPEPLYLLKPEAQESSRASQ
jgi:diacylglycerol kinase family enzyme